MRNADTGGYQDVRFVSLARSSRWFGAFTRIPKIPFAMVIMFLVCAILAPFLAPHDPIAPSLQNRSLPPGFLEGGSWDFILGTDRQGRDILSRIIYGAQVSFLTAFFTILVSSLAGVSLGLIAGYLGGWVDGVIMTLVDVSLSFPTMLIALVFAVTVGPSFAVVIAIIVAMAWSRYTRLVRGEVLSIRERDYVALARVAGASPLRIVVKHLLPNVANGIVVMSTLQVGWAIVTEGFLSFLGAGIPPPTPSWGGMVAEGRSHIATLWWISVLPGIAILIIVLSFNLLGDWLRDELDPKLRQL